MFIHEDPDQWLVLDRVDSTSSYLQRNDLPSGSVVMAREQTAGRGTHGRVWLSVPDRAFIFSTVLGGDGPDPRVPLERLAYLPLLTGLAVLEAARNVRARLAPTDAEPVRLGIKWPNDILLERAGVRGKLAGVLVETEIRGESAYRAVIGVGLNWFGLPDAAQAADASGQIEAAALFARDPGAGPRELAGDLIRRLNTRLLDLTRPGTPAFLQDVRRECWLTGRLCRVDGRVRRVRGIADSGGLLVESPAGGLEEVFGRREPVEIMEPAGE